MRDSRFLHIIRKYVLNKYVLVCVTFGVVFVFVGEPEEEPAPMQEESEE